jgi:hypothetical protein
MNANAYARQYRKKLAARYLKNWAEIDPNPSMGGGEGADDRIVEYGTNYFGMRTGSG